MASNPEQVRLNVLTKLQEALDEEAILEEQILALMHRFADRFTDRRVEINNLMVLHDHPLIEYGKYALGCMTGADMKKCVYLKSVRDELLRSMEEKRQLMTNYRDIPLVVRDYNHQTLWNLLEDMSDGIELEDKPNQPKTAHIKKCLKKLEEVEVDLIGHRLDVFREELEELLARHFCRIP
ncbi:hypothetical protein Tco_1114655 [Tanacetum coccineum]|uniref:Uncharacterized protein n=1 Tax=Tanacetum coccineum TaxID=301880 RepID=A0ABQ5IVQ4_9ASTR